LLLPAAGMFIPPELLPLNNRLHRRVAHLRLVTHSLDLGILFFRMRNNSLYLLLKLYDCRALFLNRATLLLDFAVLFEKLV
jgi:hypothetical protein